MSDVAIANHVVLFVVDGLRPDGLQEADTPHIDGLIAGGAATWQAQSVTPSITLPCHASLFLAVPPARHGVVTNVWMPPQPPVPGLIEVVHQAGHPARRSIIRCPIYCTTPASPLQTTITFVHCSLVHWVIAHWFIVPLFIVH
jgi:hypothetical protein